jgi:hypothetical protein
VVAGLSQMDGRPSLPAHTKSGCIMGTCQYAFQFNHISRLTNWSDAIAPLKTRSCAATGRWSGCWPKACPLNGGPRSLATRPTECALWPSAITSTDQRAWATGVITIPGPQGCCRQASKRSWFRRWTSHPPMAAAGPAPKGGLDSCDPGPSGPSPTGVGDAAASRLDIQGSTASPCQGRSLGASRF